MARLILAVLGVGIFIAVQAYPESHRNNKKGCDTCGFNVDTYDKHSNSDHSRRHNPEHGSQPRSYSNCNSHGDSHRSNRCGSEVENRRQRSGCKTGCDHEFHRGSGRSDNNGRNDGDGRRRIHDEHRNRKVNSHADSYNHKEKNHAFQSSDTNLGEFENHKRSSNHRGHGSNSDCQRRRENGH